MAEQTGDLNVTSGADKILSIISDEPQKTPTEESPEIEAEDTDASVEPTETLEAAEGESSDDASGEDADDTTEDAPGGDPEVKVAETLSELAEAYETDVSELYKIKVPYNVNGESKNFTLSEVKDLVQDHEKIKSQLETVAQEKSVLETERQESQTKFGERLNELASLVGVIEKQLDADENSEQLKELKDSDPGMWSAQRQEIVERRNAIEQVKREATQLFTQQQQELQQKFEQDRQELLQSEVTRLHSAIPEWKDTEIAKKEKGELQNFLHANGFTAEEISNVADHRLIVIARLAMLGSEVRNAADTAKKRVAKLPKVVRAGQAAAKEDAESSKEKTLRSKLKSTGKPEDAARLFLSRGL